YSPYGYSPFSSMLYNRYGYRGDRNMDFNYQNIAILSYDSSLNLKWSNFIYKKQESKGESLLHFLSFKTVNIGSALLFLYNRPYRGSYMLTVTSISPKGKRSRIPLLSRLGNAIHWMPKYGEQIGARTVI